MQKLQIIYINDSNNTIIITSNTEKYKKLFNVCSYTADLDLDNSIKHFCLILGIDYGSNYDFKDYEDISIEDIRNIKDCDITGVITDCYITDVIQQGIKDNKSIKDIFNNITKSCNDFFDKIVSDEYIAECLLNDFDHIYFSEDGKTIHFNYE